MKKIEWKNEGWITIQDADARKHILEVSVMVSNSQVIELIKRHNDGEGEKFRGKICEGYSLPMPLADFKAAWESGDIKLK